MWLLSAKNICCPYHGTSLCSLEYHRLENLRLGSINAPKIPFKCFWDYFIWK